jgi:hypothetical protein
MAGSRDGTNNQQTERKEIVFMKRLMVLFVVLLATGSAMAQQQPDLVIQNQKINPSYVPLGEQYTVTFTLRNSGTGLAYTPGFKVSIPSGAGYVSTNSIYPCNVQGGAVWCAGNPNSILGANNFNNFSLTFVGASTPGPFSVTIDADPAGSNQETSETNNRATLGSQWIERPKLSMASIVCPLTPRTVGQGYAFTFEVRNASSVSGVRYEAVRINIVGGPSTITNTAPQNVGAQLNTSANSHTFTWYPGFINANEKAQLTIFMNSTAAHALSATATVELENENTPADNTARCSFAVQ